MISPAHSHRAGLRPGPVRQDRTTIAPLWQKLGNDRVGLLFPRGGRAVDLGPLLGAASFPLSGVALGQIPETRCRSLRQDDLLANHRAEARAQVRTLRATGGSH